MAISLRNGQFVTEISQEREFFQKMALSVNDIPQFVTLRVCRGSRQYGFWPLESLPNTQLQTTFLQQMCYEM